MITDMEKLDIEAVAERLQEISGDNFEALTDGEHLLIHEAAYRLRIADIQARYKKRSRMVDYFFFGLLLAVVLVVGLT